MAQKNYRIRLERNTTLTEIEDIEVSADSVEEAKEVALALAASEMEDEEPLVELDWSENDSATGAPRVSQVTLLE